jgi:hypothetical protein
VVSCISSAAYTMLADIQKEQTGYDPNTNETIRDWITYKTIKCQVIPYLEGGIKGAGSSERFTDVYQNLDYARLKSQTNLNKRDRITNVRHSRSGQILWADEEGSNKPTVFNVDGCAPVINPVTGNANEYLATLSRAEVSE